MVFQLPSATMNPDGGDLCNYEVSRFRQCARRAAHLVVILELRTTNSVLQVLFTEKIGMDIEQEWEG